MLPTRAETLRCLSQVLPGKNLYTLAEEFGVRIHGGKKKNKGWMGQTIERAADLPLSSLPDRDGLDFELKTTTLIRKGKFLVPKETIKATQMNPQRILEETFLTSRLYKKLVSLILVGIEVSSPENCSVLKIQGIDLKDSSLMQPIETFWSDVQSLILAGEIAQHCNLGKVEDFIQLRPTGDGKQRSTCPISGEYFPSRAFYLTKRCIRELLELPNYDI